MIHVSMLDEIELKLFGYVDYVLGQAGWIWVTPNCANFHILLNDGAIDVILKGKRCRLTNFHQIGGSLSTPRAWVIWIFL